MSQECGEVAACRFSKIRWQVRTRPRAAGSQGPWRTASPHPSAPVVLCGVWASRRGEGMRRAPVTREKGGEDTHIHVIPTATTTRPQPQDHPSIEEALTWFCRALARLASSSTSARFRFLDSPSFSTASVGVLKKSVGLCTHYYLLFHYYILFQHSTPNTHTPPTFLRHARHRLLQQRPRRVVRVRARAHLRQRVAHHAAQPAVLRVVLLRAARGRQLQAAALAGLFDGDGDLLRGWGLGVRGWVGRLGGGCICSMTITRPCIRLSINNTPYPLTHAPAAPRRWPP